MDTRKPYSDTGNLLSMLTLHGYKRDAALGLPRPGARTLSLLDYRRQREREATKSLAGAVFLKTVIDECQKDVQQLIKVADTPEKQRAILEKVQALHALAKEAAAELEKMTYAG